MGRKGNNYRLCVAPGILGDGTFGVYMIPKNDTNLENQIASQFTTLEEAYLAANYYRYLLAGKDFLLYITPDGLVLPMEVPSELDQQIIKSLQENSHILQRTWGKILNINQPDYIKKYTFECVDEVIEVTKTRDIKLNYPFSDLSEADIKSSITEYLNKSFSKLGLPGLKSWVKIPILVAIVSMIIFYFGFSIKIPSEFPLVGEFLEDETLNSYQLALLLPIGMLILFIRQYLFGRKISMNESAIMDQILALSINHKWKRTDFSELASKLLASSDNRWLLKFYQPETRIDPNIEQTQQMLSEFVSGMMSKFEGADKKKFRDGFMIGSGLAFEEERQREKDMLEMSDFENKIHAMYYLQREIDYKPYRLAAYPLSLILNPSRYYIGTSDYVLQEHLSRAHKTKFWAFFGFLVPYGVITASLAWSITLTIQSSSSIYTVILVSIVCLLTLAIPAYRVFMVLVRKRGFPRDCFLYDSVGGNLW